MNPPFVPIGVVARWRVIYDLLGHADVGDLVKYAELGAALGLDPNKERHQIQMAVRRAAYESEQQDNRALEAVPNVGYRIVLPEEHLRLAKGQQRRSSRALVRGHSKVVHVDLNGLDAATRAAFDVVARAFNMQLDLTRRLDVNQRRLAESVAAIQDQTARSADQIAELQARLDRLEQAT